MGWLVGKALMAMCGLGVVLLAAGWAAGWSPGGKGHAGAVAGGVILTAWAGLQAWHARR